MNQDELNQDTVAVKKKKMSVEQFFQQFNTLDMNNYGSWPLSVKITCWIFVFLAVAALGYFVVIKSQLESITNAQAQEQSLLNEFREKDSKLRNLQQYQGEASRLRRSSATVFGLSAFPSIVNLSPVRLNLVKYMVGGVTRTSSSTKRTVTGRCPCKP